MADISEAAKERRRAYKREWAARNRDKVREYNRAYWERKAAQARENMEDKTREEH